MRLEAAIELVEHDPGLHGAALCRDIKLDHVIEIFGAVDDERRIDGLPALRGPGPARQHAHTLLARDGEDMLRFLDRAWRYHADGNHLIMRRIRCIAPARERVEPDVAEKLPLEPPFEPRHDDVTHPVLLLISMRP